MHHLNEMASEFQETVLIVKTKDLDWEHQEGDKRNKMKEGDREKKKEKNF